MKLDVNKFGNEIETTGESIKMRLSDNATSMIFQMFTKNIYSNPIGSIVREITSNCFDSHIEANVNYPVIIRKTYDSNDNIYYISFIDFGVGMSPERVKNIYSTYFESTKRNDNFQIGGFGIGGKTPLAYKRTIGRGSGDYDNSFFVITKYNGIKYHYCIAEGKNSPEITLLFEEKTTDRNGTEIKIPVLPNDINSFAREMVRQLYYFENIIFEGFDDTSYSDILSNEYKIIQGKTFLYRGDDVSSYIHVCLGRVAYPIDYDVLDLDKYGYEIPIAIKLNVGDINVTASREQLDYNEHTINFLKKKLDEVINELNELLIKQYNNVVTLEDYFKISLSYGQLFLSENKSIYIGQIININSIKFLNFKYNHIKIYPRDFELFALLFEYKIYGKNKKTRFSGTYKDFHNFSNLFYSEYNIRKKKTQSYLNSKYNNYIIITKRDISNERNKSELLYIIEKIFNIKLNTIDNNDISNNIVQTFFDIQNDFWNIIKKYSQNYDDLKIPEDFKYGQKNIYSNNIDKIYIMGYINDNYYKSKIKLKSLIDNVTIFYGTNDDKMDLDCAYTLFKNLYNKKHIIEYNRYSHTLEKKYSRGGVLFLKTSKSSLKYLKYCKNAYHISEFYNKLLYRKHDLILKIFQLHNIKRLYDNLSFMYKSDIISMANHKWKKIVDNVRDFIENNTNIFNIYDVIKYCNLYIKKYIDIDNIDMLPEQKEIYNMVNSLFELQRKNEDYINLISEYELKYNNTNPKLIELLKKIMVF